jgi:hypothetical protein
MDAVHAGDRFGELPKGPARQLALRVVVAADHRERVLVDLDDRCAGIDQSAHLLPERLGQCHRQRLPAELARIGEPRQRIRADKTGFDRQRLEDALGGGVPRGLVGEAPIAHEDGVCPPRLGECARLAVVGVRVEVAQQAGELEAFETARDCCLRVVPPHLAVGQQAEPGVDLLLDDFPDELVLDLAEAIAVDLATFELPVGGAKPERLPG